jgi:DNA-binding beta-propeller fold protein YncE
MTLRKWGVLTALLALLTCAAAPAAQADQRLVQLPGGGGCIMPAAIAGCTEQALQSPWGVVVRDNHVYVSDLSANMVRVYDRDPLSGALTPRATGAAGCIAENGAGTGCADGHGLAGATLQTGPFEMAMSPDGTALYVVSYTQGVVRLNRDTVTGNLTQTAGPSSCVTATGTSGECTTAAILGGADGVAVSPDNNDVYVAGQHSSGDASGFVALLDADNGGLSVHAQAQGGCAVDITTGSNCVDARAMSTTRHVAVPPDGKNVYVTSASSDAVTIFNRASDGALSAIDGEDGCIAQTNQGDGCRETDDLGQQVTEILFGSNTRGWVSGVATGSITTIVRDPSNGSLTIGPCASFTKTNGSPTAGCTDIATDSGQIFNMAVTPDGSALVAAGRFGTGLLALSIASDGSFTPAAAPLGCISTMAQTPCTAPRGYAGRGALDAQFGPAGVALSPDGHYVYAPSSAIQVDGPELMAASLDTANPACQSSTVNVASGQAVVLPLSCSDVDADAFTLAITGAPSTGTLGAIDEAAATVTYTAPETASDLTTSVSYVANSANGFGSDPGVVTINVAAPAPPPPGGGGPVTPPAGGTVVGITPAFGFVTGTVKSKWKYIGTVTIVKLVTVTGLLTGSSVTITCKAKAKSKGCPFKKRSFKPAGGFVNATKALKKAKLRKGGVLTIEISKPGWTGKLFTFKITGKKKAPKPVIKCVPPGGKPAACA